MGFTRMMLLEENQIAFHNDEGLMFDSVKDYARQLAEMIGLGSDSDFLQAGVSLFIPYLLWHYALCWIWSITVDHIPFSIRE